MRAVLGSPVRRGAALVLAVLVLAAVAVAVWPRAEQTPIATEQLELRGAQAPWDTAPVTLDATLYLPQRTPAPAVLLAHGFGGSKRSVDAQAQQLARAGFVVLAWSARGFGSSTGTISLDSLDAEVPDARALVDYLATRPEVVQDGPDDPRVGVTGASYGGALSLMLAGTDRRIDAVVPVITWHSLQDALFPNAVLAGGTEDATPAAVDHSDDGVFKKYWAATMIASVVSGTSLGATNQVDVGPAGGGVGRRSDDTSSAAPSAAPSEEPSSGDAAPSTGATAPQQQGAEGRVDPGCGRLRLEVCATYAQAADTGRLTPAMQQLLERSSPAAVVGRITAPTLLVQGELDTLFPLDQADANARAIAANGTEVAVDWYRGGHDGGSPDQATQDRITGWMVTHLRGGTMPAGAITGTGFRYSVDGGLTDSGRARTRVLQTPGYPGLGQDAAVQQVQLPLSGRDQVVLNPAGGTPAAISSLPGLGSLTGGALGALLSNGLPGQTATFTSPAATALSVVTGAARVRVTVTALATVAGSTGSGSGSGSSTDEQDGPVLFASIGTRTAGGVTTVGGNAVAPIRLPALAAGRSTTVEVALPAAALQLSAGDTLFVRFATTDQAYSTPTQAAAYRISDVTSVTLPQAGGTRVSAAEVSPFFLVGMIVLAVLGIAALFAAGLTRRREKHPVGAPATGSPEGAAAEGAAAESTERDGRAPLPLEIRGLRKSYPGGVAAVKDVSLQVHPGRVVGLLGPNGAGKTTTLRMVMGLILPTAGEITVFGRPVAPGAEILSRIGSFVEGSGFLPHLSGQRNLELYWRATGRPVQDAHLEEVLQIAGLGTAVKRRVRTYSQGMRQRLAIAQAMLGLPDLLILDEPTNGLDPPQIHAMREVLRGYARTGRTVLVSSHLLSEVEQTCQDVVVIHQGVTIASGRVVDLVAGSGEMAFVVGDADRAEATLRGLDGVRSVSREVGDDATAATTVVYADLGGVPASQAIAELVGAGVAVMSAAPRNRLEDVFLDMIGQGGGDGATAAADSAVPAGAAGTGRR